MNGPDVVEQAPPSGRGRGRVLLVALVVALVAGFAAFRLLDAGDPPADRAREPVDDRPAPGPDDSEGLTGPLVLTGGTTRTSGDGESGYLVGIRSGWPTEIAIASVTPLDASGGEVPHRSALVLDPGLSGQEQFHGTKPAPAGPVAVPPDTEAAVGLKVSTECPGGVVRVAALLFRFTAPGPADQVLPLPEREDRPFEAGVGCPAPTAGA